MSSPRRAGRPWPAWARYGLPLAALGAVVAVPRLRQRGGSVGEAPAPSETRGAPRRESPRPGAIDVSSLLLELTDLERLAREPDPPYTSHLAASYDRRSRTAEDKEGWFANDDWASRERPNYVRVEERAGRREFVLLDAEGPGAIVRWWTAGPTGTLRVYVDGATTPVVSARMANLMSGAADFPRSLAYVAARGYNAYFPLPFAKSCKVTVDDLITTDPFRGGPLEKFYYQLNYRLYPPEVASRIESYRAGAAAQATAAVARASEILAQTSLAYVPSPERRWLPLEPSLTGAKLSLETSRGTAIRELVVKVRDTSDQALRRATLTLTFDRERTVSAPLGDFFAAGPGFAPYESLPFAVRSDGSFVSRWVMPFGKSLEVEIQDSPGVEAELSLEPHAFSEKTLYFHAAWRPTARAGTQPYSDLQLASLEGRGRYVGTAFTIDNARNERWWGEGDEKIYVDGAPFPQLFGTGTEDYFGFAWSTTELFARPFHAQTRAEGPGFFGRAAMNRFHVLDDIPFTGSLRFDLELWHWQDAQIAWEAMAYYYARSAR